MIPSWNSATFQKAFGNFGWLLAERVLRMGIGLVVTSLVARQFGPERFASLAYALAVLAFFQVACSLGLDAVLARDLVSAEGRRGKLLGTSLRLRVLAGLVGWVLSGVAILSLRPGDMEGLLLVFVLGSTLAFQPAELLDLWFQSQSEGRRAAVPRLVGFVLVSVVRLALLASGMTLLIFALTYVLEALLACWLLLREYRSKPARAAWVWDGCTARYLVKEAIPLLISALAIIAYMRIDQLLLRAISGDFQLGLYSAVLPFSQAWHVIAATICTSAMPVLVNRYKQGERDFYRLVSRMFALLTWLSIGIAALMALCGGGVIRLLLGDAYAPAADVLRIHALSNVPVFLGILQARVLMIIGKPLLITAQAVIGLSSSIVLNLLLIPGYGATGAAVACVAAYVISAILCNLFFARRVFRMQVLSWLRPNA